MKQETRLLIRLSQKQVNNQHRDPNVFDYDHLWRRSKDAKEPSGGNLRSQSLASIAIDLNAEQGILISAMSMFSDSFSIHWPAVSKSLCVKHWPPNVLLVFRKM